MMKKCMVSLLALMTLAVCGGCADKGKDSAQGNSSLENSSTITSVEEEGYCLVGFDTDNAGEIDTVSVKKGEKLKTPPTPQKSSQECEYEFLGWFFGEKLWNFETDVVTEDMTLVAHWKEGAQYTDPFLPKN